MPIRALMLVSPHCRYTGMDGVYTHTVKYEKDAACPMCSASVPFEVSSKHTLQQVRHCSLVMQCSAMSLLCREVKALGCSYGQIDCL